MMRCLLPLFILISLTPHIGSAQQDWSRLNQWQVACTTENTCQMTYENRLGRAIQSKILIYRVGDAIILEYTIPPGIDVRRGVSLEVDST